MNPTIVITINSAVLLAAIAVLLRVAKHLNRDESLKRDYPPHRHVEETIVYPREFEPGRVQHLGGKS